MKIEQGTYGDEASNQQVLFHTSRKNLTSAIQKIFCNLEEVSSDAKPDKLMCAVYEYYVAKKMEKDKENVNPSPRGAPDQNVFINMINCNFVTLVVGSNSSTEAISKVLQSFNG